MTLSIDFETRSDVDLKKEGLDRYVSSPEACVLCLAYETLDGEVKLWTPDMDPPTDLLDYVCQGGHLRGWNIMFEMTVWNTVCADKYGWPRLDLYQLEDTMAQAAAFSLPQGLGNCAIALGLPEDQQKNKRGKYLINKLCVPHEPTKKRTSKWIDDPALLQELYDYCVQDVIVESTIARMLPTLSAKEMDTWRITQRINRAGIPVDVEEVRRMVSVVEAETQRLQDIAYEITGGIYVTQRDALISWLHTRGVVMTAMDAESVQAVLRRSDIDYDVERVLLARAAVSQTSTAKYAKILEIVAEDDTIKNLHVYHGAGTGRWASRGGFNCQNLKRPEIDHPEEATELITRYFDDLDFLRMMYPDLLTAVSSCVRSVIKAPPGSDFMDADFSSVENRVGPWLADDQDTLELFRRGLDEYKVFASQMYNVAYEDVSKDQRLIGKSACLGCLFGQGPKGFIAYAAKYKVYIDIDRSTEIVALYRDNRKKVVNFWYKCGDASLQAIRHPKTVVSINSKLSFYYDKERDFLYMKLPSGRCIAYPQPREELRDTPWGAQKPVLTYMGMDSHTFKWSRQKAIGANLFQNAVQGIARDLLAEALPRLEEANYKPVMLVHDELLALVDSGHGSEEEFIELMCVQPDWAEGLPIGAGSWRGKRYKKD